MSAPAFALGIADAWVYKSGNLVYVKHPLTGRILAKRKCLGQALMDCLEWLIDKKAQTEDKLVKIILGPYKFQVTEQPIVIIDLFKKFNTEYPYHQTGIAIIGSEPMTMIDCQDGLPTFLTVRNQTVLMPYMNNNIYLDKIFVKLWEGEAVIDIINTGTLWIGELDIWALNSEIGFRAVHVGSGDHRSIIHGLRVTGAEVNVYIDWDFRWIGFITSLEAKKHFAILAGINYCCYLHTYAEIEETFPPIVIKKPCYIARIRREGVKANTYIFFDATNAPLHAAGLSCDCLFSDTDWYGTGKTLWAGCFGPCGGMHIKKVVSGLRNLGEIIYVGTDYVGPVKRLEVHGKTVLEITKDGVALMVPPFQIGGTPVTVPAGSTYTIASITVPSGKKLIICGIKEVYDPAGTISAEVYNVTDGQSVTGDVDGEDWNIYEIPEGKTVEFRLKNADTANAQIGAYIFRVSIVEA